MPFMLPNVGGVGVTDGGAPVSLLDGYARLAGRAGGQIIQGGTAASEILTLQSTAHATKGRVRFGSATGLDFDETTGCFALGAAADTYGGAYHLFLRRPVTAIIGVEATSSASGSASIQLFGGPRGAYFSCNSFSVAGSTHGELNADLAMLYASGCDRLGMSIAGSFPLIFNTNSTRRMTIEGGGTVRMGPVVTPSITAGAMPSGGSGNLDFKEAGGVTVFSLDSSNDCLKLGATSEVAPGANGVTWGAAVGPASAGGAMVVKKWLQLRDSAGVLIWIPLFGP